MRARAFTMLLPAVVLTGCPGLLSDWRVANSVALDASSDAPSGDGASDTPSVGGKTQNGSGEHTTKQDGGSGRAGDSAAGGTSAGARNGTATGGQLDGGQRSTGGELGVDAQSDAGGTSRDSGTCINDLSNTLNRDFRILFDVLAKADGATVGDGPLLEQRAICDPYSEHWVIAEQGTRIIIEIGDGTNLASVTSVASVNDGTWHHVYVARVGDTLSVALDGTLDNSVPGAGRVSLGPLALLQVGRSACTQAYAGEIKNVCLMRP